MEQLIQLNSFLRSVGNVLEMSMSQEYSPKAQ